MDVIIGLAIIAILALAIVILLVDIVYHWLKGMSKLYFVNYFILQWFFIRLTRHTERIIDEVDMIEASMLSPHVGQVTGIGFGVKRSHVLTWYSIQYWVIPCTGWTTFFKYIGGKPKFWRITKQWRKDEGPCMFPPQGWNCRCEIHRNQE